MLLPIICMSFREPPPIAFAHPSTLQFGRIESSLKSLCRDVANATGLKIETAIPSGIDVRSDVPLCLYRVTQECLHNIIKHSGADLRE